MSEFDHYSDWKIHPVSTQKGIPRNVRKLFDMTRGQVILLLRDEGVVNYRLEKQ